MPLPALPARLRRGTPADPTAPLHATPAELTVWRARTQDPAFAADWQRLSARAAAFRAAPDTALWPGNTLAEPWDAPRVVAKAQGANRHPGRRRAEALRDAAFVALLTRDATARAAVLRALTAQVACPGTAFDDPARWDPTRTGGDYNNFEIVTWLRKLAYAYSYVRAHCPAATRQALEGWFQRAAHFWLEALTPPARSRFPGRDADQYCTPQGPHTPGRTKGLTHLDGYAVTKFQEPWFNIPAAGYALLGVVGVLVGDQALCDAATRFVTEWLRCAVAPDGTVADQFRWTDVGDPQMGYGYAGTVLGSVLTIADHLARAGDRALYHWTTAEGYFGWAGGPKSLLLCMQRFAQRGLAERDLPGGVAAYAQTAPPLLAAQRIGPGPRSVVDLVLAPAQVYYQDATVAALLARPRPARPTAGGYDPWGGDWGCFPSLPFQCDGLAGTVWPYP
jgi:hypothetical protein